MFLSFLFGLVLSGCEKINVEKGENTNNTNEENSSLVYLGKYSKDNNKVYYLDKELKGADPKSFEVFKEGYAKDKSNVYLYGKIKKELDSKTFQYLEVHYTKDKNNVYWLVKKIKDVNPNTFMAFKDDYTKDKNNVYYGCKKFDFTYRSMYAKDKNNCYNNGKIEEQNCGKFLVKDDVEKVYLVGKYSRDKEKFYYLII